jgi:hypothetical protein
MSEFIFGVLMWLAHRRTRKAKRHPAWWREWR